MIKVQERIRKLSEEKKCARALDLDALSKHSIIRYNHGLVTGHAR